MFKKYGKYDPKKFDPSEVKLKKLNSDYGNYTMSDN